MAKQQRRDLNREAFWRGVMKRFGKSGLTARAFCASEQLSEPSFYAWRRMLPQRAQGRSRPLRPRISPRDAASIGGMVAATTICRHGSVSPFGPCTSRNPTPLRDAASSGSATDSCRTSSSPSSRAAPRRTSSTTSRPR